jgi:3-methyl-2-oxobutanoate hydroxymethyltransferase
MTKPLTVMDLRALKGVRQISFVQVAREEEAVAASDAGIDMIGTAFIPERISSTACHGASTPTPPKRCAMPWRPCRPVPSPSIAG